MPRKPQMDFSPLPDEAAMARLSFAHWEQSEAETMAEYVIRRRTFDLAALVRQVIEEELTGTEQQVIRLRFYDNLMTHEIAQRLRMNKSSVSRALTSAEEHIRQYLKYVVRYQYDLEHVPFLPLAVRKAMAVSAARYGKPDAASALRRLRTAENLSAEKVADAVGAVCPAIAAAVDLIADRLAKGGRLVYIGCGTSGRLGVLDAAECPPTFSADPETVRALIAGGPGAVFRSAEGAEDDRDGGKRDLEQIGFGPG
ncbi:MAG: hypothetical protein IKW76_01595, partial [Clostridia bacterium]|nr:hypothetical protein [Clostridia bacterium]